MGAIAEGIVAYAKPLLDETDGSLEQMNKALQIAQLCFNLALLSEETRNKTLRETQQNVGMDDEEFEAFRFSVLDPMIRRHEEMFPRMRRQVQSDPSPREHPKTAAPPARGTTVDRYAPCPCNSGKKYKFCCGEKGRG